MVFNEKERQEKMTSQQIELMYACKWSSWIKKKEKNKDKIMREEIYKTRAHMVLVSKPLNWSDIIITWSWVEILFWSN